MKQENVLRINNLKLRPDHSDIQLEHMVKKTLGLKDEYNVVYEIVKRSIDARHKPDIMYVYSVDVKRVSKNGVNMELKKLLKKKNNNILYTQKNIYEFPVRISKGSEISEEKRPVIIGFGPAGMFAALKLSEAGLRPVVYERGDKVEIRQQKVNSFWGGGELDTESNVQFGEGGAGTFSDGKLNTVIKDPTGRIRNVLETFVRFGADADILCSNKPHIGTDVLAVVVKNIREYCESLGAQILFRHRLEDIELEAGGIRTVTVYDMAEDKRITRKCENVCLAIGHSARDTFEMLNSNKIIMEPKAFAVGLRIMHPQEFINNNAYGGCTYDLPAADYKVTYKSVSTGKERGVYSFCMCPGGRVVASASEDGGVVTNGMSYFARDGKNANSALLVNVTPSDFKTDDPLAGMYFQREIEQRAFEVGGKNYNAPCQRVGDFLGTESNSEYTVEPTYKPNVTWVNLDEVFPKFITDSMREGIVLMDNKLHGFADSGAVITGPETRSSSPVRIIRDKKTMQSNIKGLYPCGEGAGYAGGIMSAAVDGIKTAEMVAINNGRGKNEQ